MKTRLILIIMFIVTISCKKENDSFISKYEPLCVTWKTQSISYDSSGIVKTKTTRYDRLIIYNNLTYKLFLDSINQIENGVIKIISQSNDKLELSFTGIFPSYSSFAGSHLFDQINSVKLISLSSNSMILKSSGNAILHDIEYHFER